MTDGKRRRGWPFDDESFGPFEEVFEEMRRRMEKLMSESLPDLPDLADLGSGKPFVWGYSIRIGPDGKPQFRQFGDTRVLRPGSEEPRREPMTDILEWDDSLSVTVELPGVEREDVDLRVTENRLVISVDRPDRPYCKELELPAPVDPDSVRATYKNGVLDVTLTKTSRGQGKRVPID